MIRLTGGRFKGRQIQSPNNDKIRPTTGLVRESIFNQLQGYITDARFLDCFAGSGLMGFEALSRGAKSILAIEKNPAHARLIRQNVSTLKLEPSQYQLRQKAVEQQLKQSPERPYDLVFMDPPYGYSNITEVLTLLATNHWVNNESLILVEQATEDAFLNLGQSKNYGNTRITKITGKVLIGNMPPV